MGTAKIVILQMDNDTASSQCLQKAFDAEVVSSLDAVLSLLMDDDFKSLVIDFSSVLAPDFDLLCETLLKHESLANIPTILLCSNDSLSLKLKAYELGCDDYIGPDVDCDEMRARIHKSIFNQIANEQLKSRLEEANSAAYMAMLDNSDLGYNQRFLLGVGGCDNLDQLGLLFFSTLEHYQLSCSLQMRSQYGTKNMEANGMAKDLESQLLEQMSGEGRYIDFGRRTIVNYGLCSLLVRNMPLDDERKYGAIKDNTFALVQGIHARIVALDEHQRLQEEKQALQKLSRDVKEVILAIDESYQGVMRDIVSGVEDMAERIADQIPSLALSLEQEQFFEQVTGDCVANTSDIFNKGLKVDECFKKLTDDMENTLNRLEVAEQHGCEVSAEQQIEEQSDGVELF